MITVAFLNQKGGVGKTSLCHHLGGALADLGNTVLLVDYDPQASLTQGLLGPDAVAMVPPDRSVAEIAAGEDADPAEILVWCEEAGVWLVPGSSALAEYNLAGPFRRDLVTERDALRGFLAEAASERVYEYCLIDCPPNLQLCAAQALAAAEFFVVPTQPEDYGAQGLRPVIEFADRSRETDSDYLNLAGIVINQRKSRATLHALYEGRVRAAYSSAVFAAVVPDWVGYPEAIAHHLPITRHDPRSNAAEAMRVLALEFLERTRGDLP